MIESSIARRYAKALFEIGREKGKAELFLDQISSLHQLCQEHPFLQDTLANRFMDLKARLNIIDDLGAKMGLDEMVVNFLKILIQKGRIRLMPFVFKNYRTLMYSYQNKIEAVISTAKPLEEKIYKELSQALQEITGKTVVTTKELRPEVLGGISVRIGGEVFDGTVKAQLEKMSLAMRQHEGER